MVLIAGSGRLMAQWFSVPLRWLKTDVFQFLPVVVVLGVVQRLSGDEVRCHTPAEHRLAPLRNIRDGLIYLSAMAGDLD